jgi:hypothetical protein
MHFPALRFALAVAALLACSGLQAQDAGKVTRERWRSLFLGGTQIGYVHETLRLKSVDGRNVVVNENVVVMEYASKRRVGRVITPAARSTVAMQTEESETGELLAFRYDNQNPAPLPSTVRTGRVENGILKIETHGKRPSTTETPWKAEVKGPAYADRMLIDTPLKPQETRTITTFDPRTAQVDTVTFVARDKEQVLLHDGTEKLLLHVVGRHSIADGIEFHEFVDDAGESWKTTIPSQDLVVHTVPRDVALKAFPDDLK